MRTILLLTLITFTFTIFFSTFAAANLQDGLIVYYPFDEADGITASDKSKNNNDATLLGNATWQPNGGKIGGALKLDGLGSSAEDENGADYINGLDAFSVSVWVKSDTVPNDRGIIFGRDPDGGDDTFGFRYDSASWAVAGGTNLIKGAISTTGGGQSIEGKSDVQTTEWQHIVFTWSSGQQLAIYIDAELDEDPIHNTNATNGEISGATKLMIGKGAKDNAGTSWSGLIDDVRIYNRELDKGEISSLATGVLPVEPDGKAATTWGLLKQIRY